MLREIERVHVDETTGRNGDLYVKVFPSVYCPSEVTEFVADIYYYKSNFQFDTPFEDVLKIMLEEDLLYAEQSKTVCVYQDSGELCCTARLIRKDGMQLPFEEEFNMELGYICNVHKDIFELARLASVRKNSLKSLHMLTRTLYDLVTDKESTVVAGLEKGQYKRFMRAKYPLYTLGHEKDCLGTATVPIGLKVKEIPAFCG